MKIHRDDLFRQKPGVILLDLDNTLYEYEPCHRAGMQEAKNTAQQNLNISGNDFEQHFREARAEIKARLGGTAASHHRLLYFQRTLERAGFASDVRTALQMEKAYWCAYLDTMRLFESVIEFLDDLRIAGIPVILVTDLVASIQYRKVLLLGLDSWIDGIITSEGSGREKPDPLSFELAVARVSETAKSSIWMIGDNADVDLTGAKNAVGATTLHKVHEGIAKPTDPTHVDATFATFAELRSLLDRLAQ